jgi:SAM-dependent methyltransferase
MHTASSLGTLADTVGNMRSRIINSRIRSCYIREVEDFDLLYGTTPDYFGAEGEASLIRFFDLLDRSRPVLDVGCGQGRNTFFLARRGYSVVALDPSSVALEQVATTADENGLEVRTVRGTFQGLGGSDRPYGGILLFGLIPLLDRVEIAGLARLVMADLGDGGLCFVTAFGTWDPDRERRAAEWREEGLNSYRSPDGRLRTYLEPGELVKLFPDLSPVHSWEGMSPEHRHGDGPVERHGFAEAVLRRS